MWPGGCFPPLDQCRRDTSVSNVAFEASDLADSRPRSAPEKGSSSTSVLLPTIATVFDVMSEGMQYVPSAVVSFNPV